MPAGWGACRSIAIAAAIGCLATATAAAEEPGPLELVTDGVKGAAVSQSGPRACPSPTGGTAGAPDAELLRRPSPGHLGRRRRDDRDRSAPAGVHDGWGARGPALLQLDGALGAHVLDRARAHTPGWDHLVLVGLLASRGRHLHRP